MVLILYGILLAHLNAYKDHYAKVGITFATTFLVKRVVKSANQIEHSDLIGLGGYSLTIGEFFKLIGVIKKSGIRGTNVTESNDIIGGLFGKGIELLKDLVIKE